MIESYSLAHGQLRKRKGLGCEVLLFVEPDSAERELLQAWFHLDAHALASALDPDEVSRLELHRDGVLMVLALKRLARGRRPMVVPAQSKRPDVRPPPSFPGIANWRAP